MLTTKVIIAIIIAMVGVLVCATSVAVVRHEVHNFPYASIGAVLQAMRR